ncbi:hypothetical protein [Flavobacterium akiainvivens]|uniref:hypothetical protein n=1 Tax=Flavobacterium akiainvivens TaxID=1202724 RepID=UPI0008EFE143|nr:hypothetical protein [Flavobacterium akiainvivens]SFQ74706.1 hypothetical protein SAMN05444144_12052 [Flavobacterium akiainvivens]
MKKIILAFATLSTIFFFACTNEISETSLDSSPSSLRIHPQDKAGEVINGNFVITENLSALYTDMNANLTANGLANVHSFEIKESSTRPGSYMLVGASSDDTVKSGIPLTLANNVFYINFRYSSSNSLVANQVTCTGCTRGCSPGTYTDSNGQTQNECTPCEFLHGQSCTKTETTITKPTTSQ